MKRLYHRVTIAFLVTLLLIFLGTWLTPTLIAALPTRYKLYLPDELIALATTPLPTALPTAAIVAPVEITIPTIATNTPTPTLTPIPSPTHTPIAIDDSGDTTAVPTPTLKPTQTSTPLPTATNTPQPPPPRAAIDGLQIIPQKFNNCGPANLTIVLNYYDHPSEQLEIGGVLKPNYDDRNVSPWELRDYVNDYTPLQATMHSGGDITLLKHLLAAGFPVIIEKGLYPDEQEGWMGHYLTLFGYDDAEQNFYSHDTFLGPWDSSGRTDSYDSLDTFWSHFNYTFIVVHPPDQTKQVQRLVGETLAQPLLMWQSAAQRAQAATAIDPQNPYAWFNLGTNLTQLGHLTQDPAFYQNAAAAFDQARQIGLPPRMLWYQFEPYEAYLATGRLDDVMALTNATLIGAGGQNVEETYLYRGHALLANGDTDAARAAYNRALHLHQDFAPALTAIQQLNN